jgi:2-keto-4-pentenoate hydratase/2-oxohepta-3-ene-1,7-dioic acid hydratase in catechol pathway
MSQTIYCIGRNYADHARELNNPVPTEKPVVFLKASPALRGLEPSPMAFAQQKYHHEIEIVLRVGKDLTMGQKATLTAIDAITLGLDLTRRDEQYLLKKDGLPWTTAKSFKGSAVMGPWINARDINFDHPLKFSLKVNQELRQSGDTSHMIFTFEEILTYLLTFNDLHASDLIFTGTPKGVAEIQVGDPFTMSLEQPHRIFEGRL